MDTRFQEMLGEQHARFVDEIAALPISDIVDRIATLADGLARFWNNAGGWAPADAAQMLSSARLDRIASLAHSLRRWVQEDTLSVGDLILAWANLGALMEGALKLFLCVYLADYRADETTRETRAWHIKRQVLQDPDELMLDTILAYAEKAELLAPQQIALGRTVQARRNAIHAFRDRDLGSLTDLFAAIRDFRALLCSLNGRMEYPEPRYMPTERTHFG